MFKNYSKKAIFAGLFTMVSTASMAQTARVQVIHNCADDIADSVDVYLNGTKLLDNFAFRNASPFIDAPAGSPINIDVAPKTSTSVANSIYNLNTTLTAGGTYVLVANGITGLSSTVYSNTPAFGLDVYALGRESASMMTNTDVLISHGSTDAPTVDVYENGTLNTTAADDLAYGAFAGYLELPTADYVIEVKNQTGTAVVASYDAPLATLGLNGGAATVVASGFLNPAANGNGPAFGLYVALPAGGELVPLPVSTARLQVIHNCADDIADSVDVYLNGDLLLDNFAFRNATAFIDAPAGVEIEIDVAPKTSTSVTNSIYNLPATLTSGKTYILVADGITGLSSTTYSPAPAFGLEIFAGARESATMMSNTDVLVHHGSTDAPTVDVFESSALNANAVDDISYPEFAGYLELATADYVLEIKDATGTTTVVSYDAPLSTLNLDGQAITVVASGFLDPTVNGNGPAFGLHVALAAGGELVPLPVTTVGIKENLSDLFKVYPTITNNVVNVNAINGDNFEYIISDLSGKVLDRGNNNNTLDFSNYAKGVYSLNIISNGKVHTQKIVKE